MFILGLQKRKNPAVFRLRAYFSEVDNSMMKKKRKPCNFPVDRYEKISYKGTSATGNANTGAAQMVTIYAIHAPESKKLEQVKAQMAVLGVPAIRVVDCGDYFMALEGSHRLAAAHALGIEPELVIFEQDEIIDISGYDWYEHGCWAETNYAAGEVAGELFCAQQARSYMF